MTGSDHNYYDMSNNKGPGSIEVTVISATLGPRGGSESGIILSIPLPLWIAFRSTDPQI